MYDVAVETLQQIANLPNIFSLTLQTRLYRTRHVRNKLTS